MNFKVTLEIEADVLDRHPYVLVRYQNLSRVNEQIEKQIVEQVKTDMRLKQKHISVEGHSEELILPTRIIKFGE